MLQRYAFARVFALVLVPVHEPVLWLAHVILLLLLLPPLLLETVRRGQRAARRVETHWSY